MHQSHYKSYVFHSLNNDNFPSISKLPLLTSGQVGHGITQAFTSGQDVPYKAVTTVLKASIDRITMLQEIQEDEKMPKSYEFFGIVFSIIVIDGSLFECNIANNEEISLNKVGYSKIQWKNRLPTSIYPEVYIVTKEYLGNFLNLVNETTNRLIENFIKGQ
ncbi:MAG: hypothetical protein HND47_03185 [Chloroflexi bacterium]|nr:hypothetical protein [Chloroflexota bacterium]